MKKTLIIAILMLAAGVAQAQIQISVEDREKAASLVKQMTLEEKCALITGQDDGFHTAAIPRLGIPSVRMADGPQGVRNKTHSTTVRLLRESAWESATTPRRAACASCSALA